jgi:glycerol-3-phosphate cytidylyltransferase
MKEGIIAGNFDVIHPGYIHMFNECKKNCDRLIVMLHEDPSIERPEKLKPILSADERIFILESLDQVDEIIVYQTENDLIEWLEHLKPDVRFLGDDYIGKSYSGDYLGINIVYLDRSHGWSTTKYKEMIADSIARKEIDLISIRK